MTLQRLLSVAVVAAGFVAPWPAAAQWKSHSVRQLNGTAPEIPIPARLQTVSERWHDSIALVPYLVYMSEKDRLLMLFTLQPEPPKPGLREMLVSSDDRGATWSTPRPLRREESTEVACSLTYLGQGNLLYHADGYRCFSSDYGATWEPVRVDDPAEGKIFFWDPLLVERDDKTGAVTRLFETGWNERSGDGPSHEQGYLRFSADKGRIWSKLIRVPQWENVSEVALGRAANGDLIAGCRTSKAAGDIDHYEGLGISISKDGGHTWSEINRLYQWGRHHPSFVLMPNHDIVMSYVARKGYVATPDGYPQYGIEAVVSHDHGQTWDLDHRYLLHTWVGNRKGPDISTVWASCQATSSVLLPDGSILTAFGTGFRSQPGPYNSGTPRDLGLVRWGLGDQPLNGDREIRDAPYDSDLRNVIDPATGKPGRSSRGPPAKSGAAQQ